MPRALRAEVKVEVMLDCNGCYRLSRYMHVIDAWVYKSVVKSRVFCSEEFALISKAAGVVCFFSIKIKNRNPKIGVESLGVLK